MYHKQTHYPISESLLFSKHSDGFDSVGVTFAVDKPALLAGIGATTTGPYGLIDVGTLW